MSCRVQDGVSSVCHGGIVTKNNKQSNSGILRRDKIVPVPDCYRARNNRISTHNVQINTTNRKNRERARDRARARLLPNAKQ